MGHARYVGRVGMLAAALGVGVAIATCPVAAADTGTAAESQDRAGTTVRSVKADRPAPGSARDKEPASTSESDPGAGDDEPSDDEQPDSSLSEVDPDPTEPDDDVLPREPDAEADESSSRQGRKPASAPVLAYDTPDVIPDRSVDTDEQSTVDKPATRSDAETDVDAPAENIITQATPGFVEIPQASTPTVELAAREPVSSPLAQTVQQLFGGLLTPGPADPGLSPVMWALLAAARRPLGSGDSEADALAMTALAAAATNTAPVASLRRVGAPSWSSGRVTGSVTATDADRDRLSYAATPTAKGSVRLTSSGSFTYTPTAAARHAAAASNAPESARTDSFTIVVSDGKGGTAEVPVTVAIKPANSAPSSVRSTVAKPVSTSGVVTGRVTAIDRDGDGLFYAAAAPTQGTVTFDSDGAFTYTPSAAARIKARSTSYTDTDRFTVTVSDGHGGVKTTTVRVQIAPTNEAPTAGTPTLGAADSATGRVRGSVNATDPDGDRITYTPATSTTAKGTFSITSAGMFTYTPTAAARHAAATGTPATTTDTVTVTVTDKLGAVAAIPVTVVIAPINKVPGNPKIIVGQPNSSTGVVTGSVTATDADNDTLAYSGTADTTKGHVVVDPAGAFTFTPTAEARLAAGAADAPESAKADTFVVTIADGHGGSATVTVSVAIGGATNNAPGGTTIVGEPDSGGRVTGSVVGIDPDGDPVTYGSGTQTTAKGSVVVSASGSFVYTPTLQSRRDAYATSHDDVDLFAVTVTDIHGRSTLITVTVPIRPDSSLGVAELTDLVHAGTVEIGSNSDGTVRVIGGSFLDTVVESSADAAAALNRITELLGVPTGFFTAGQIRATTTGSGDELTHVYTVRPVVNGVAVLGSPIALFTDSAGAVTGLLNNFDGRLTEVDTTPSNGFGEQGAASAVAAEVLSSIGPATSQELDALFESLLFSTELVIHNLNPDAEAPRLAWRVNVFNAPTDVPEAAIPQINDTYYLFANGAEVGAVLGKSSSAEGATVVTETATDALGMTRPIPVEVRDQPWPFPAEYVLRDTARNLRIFTANIFKRGERTVITGASEVKKGFFGNWAPAAAISAMANIVYAHDFYKGIDAHFFDADDAATIYVTGDAFGNAYWYGNSRQLIFTGSLATAPDVAAHEFTHAVIQEIMTDRFGFLDPVTLGGNPQAAALNEAYADLMGSLIEAKLLGLSKISGARWSLGESIPCGASECIIRDAASPHSQNVGAYHYHSDFGDYEDTEEAQYRNSTIFTHAAYLMMTDGRTIADVPDSTWAKVFYTSLTTMPMNATFADARFSVVQAAKRYGFDSSQLAAVNEAFDAVHIATLPNITTPPAPAGPKIVAGQISSPGTPTGAGDLADVAAINATGTRAVFATDEPNDEINESRIVLIDTATGKQVGGTLVVNGNALMRFNPSGSRVVVASVDVDPVSGTATTLIRVLNSLNGSQLGSTITLRGASWLPDFSAAGDRVVLTAFDNDTGITRVALVDTTTGTQRGNTLTLQGGMWGGPTFTPTGDRLMLLTLVTDGPNPGQEHSEFIVVNTATGAVVGSTNLMPDRSGFVLSADGSRAMVMAMLSPATAADTPMTRVTVIDTATGQRVGSVVTIVGELSGQSIDLPTPSASGRAVITTVVSERSSGQWQYTGRLTTIDLATGTQVGTTQVLGGGALGFTAQTPGGSRTVVMIPDTAARDYRVSIIDTVTGRQIGSTVRLPGEGLWGAHFNASGTRVTLTAATGNVVSTSFLALNTATGAQVGQTLTLPGQLQNPLSQYFNAAGTRMAIATTTDDGRTRVAVFDATTGTQVGSTVTLSGSDLSALYDVRVSSDGTRALVSEARRIPVGPSSWLDEAGRVTVIDMATGAIVGQPVSVPGSFRGEAKFTGDGNRIVIATELPGFNSPDYTSVAVVDAKTGQQVGTTVTLFGEPTADAVVALAPGGRRAVIATHYFGTGNDRPQYTDITVLDLGNGAQIGDTLTVSGDIRGSVQFNADGSRATVASDSYDASSTHWMSTVTVLDLTVS